MSEIDKILGDEADDNSPASENKEGETAGDANKGQEGGDGGKDNSETVDYYKEQLTKLQEEKDKRAKDDAEKIAHKNRAIEALKRENKEDIEEMKQSLKDELLKGLKEEILPEIKGIVNEDKINREIDKYAKDDENAKKLIRLHYDKVFSKSEIHSSLEDKVKAAAVSANQDFILNQGIKEGMEKKREEIMASFTGSKTSSQPAGNDADPVYQMLKRHRPEALKNPKVLEKLK